MFGESLIVSAGKPKARKTWLTLPLSLIVHALIVASFVIVPLMMAESNLPEAKITNIFMSAPPPPPPPPPPPGKKKVEKKTESEQEKKLENKPIVAGRLVAPVEVPQQIRDEDVGSFGIEGGIDGGVEGGVEGGVIGGVIGGVDDGQITESNAIRVASVQRPKRIKEVVPVYPPVALQARIQGVVVVEAQTDVYGRVKTARVITGHPLLNDSALTAVRQWVYEPYILNGIPKPVLFTVTVTFSLSNQQ